MRYPRWQWIGAVGLLLLWTVKASAQDEPEQLSDLDRLPVWRFSAPPSAPAGRLAPDRVRANTYTDVDTLLRRQTAGQRIEAFEVTGPGLGPQIDKLRALLPYLRVLTLKNLTAAEASSLLSPVPPGARLQRLTIDITRLGGRIDPNRLVCMPTALRHFSRLSDIRIQEDGLNWAASLPVLASLKALKRLEINRWQSTDSEPPRLATLRRLTALHLRNGWSLTPETIGFLPRLTELTLASSSVETGPLAQTLNRLPALKTLRLTKCWQVQTLALGALRHLKTVELAYNDKLRVDVSTLAGLTRVERLTLKGGPPVDLAGLESLTRLRYLNVMGSRQVIRLPEHIDQLGRLTDLRLYEVNLGSLPARFGGLHRLQTLHLNYCGLDSLAATFGRLRALSEVRLYGNRLTQLPGLEHLVNLRRLDVSGNHFTILPERIGQLTRLIALNVSENQLTALPAALTRLGKLQQLAASHNRLRWLPDNLGRLKKLTDLSVLRNQLTQLPPSLSRLVNLKALSADYNQLDSLPNDMGRMRNLRFLSLDHNQLVVLPASLGQLDSLHYLWLGQNRLRALPAGFSQLRSLNDLSIDANELTALPADFGDLRHLTHLLLAKLPLSALPASVGRLVNLQSLIITDTPLRALPDSIGALVNLQFVRLVNTALTTLPSSMGGWRSVTVLDLTGNRLERLPNGIGRLTRLTELTITGKAPLSAGVVSSLRQLPDSLVRCDRLQTLTLQNQPELDADDVFGKAARLKNLTTLSVINCNISRLPEVAWKAVRWQKLFLTDNQLTALPFGLVDVPELQYVSASGNRLPNAMNRNLQGQQALLSAFAEAGKLPIETVVKPNRKLAEILRQSAFDKESTQDWPGTLRALTVAIDYAPDTVRARFYASRARFYAYRNEYVNALADYDTAIAYAPRLQKEQSVTRRSANEELAMFWQRRAAVAHAMGQNEVALAGLQQAERIPLVDNEWLSALIQVERGTYLTSMGRLGQADSSYRKAIQLYERLSHGNSGSILRVAELSLLTGQYNRAQQIVDGIPAEQVQNGYATWRVYLNLCIAVLTGRQTGKQALGQLTAYIATNPEKVYSWTPVLFENWLVNSKLPPDKVQALRQLTDATKKPLPQP